MFFLSSMHEDIQYCLKNIAGDCGIIGVKYLIEEKPKKNNKDLLRKVLLHIQILKRKEKMSVTTHPWEGD